MFDNFIDIVIVISFIGSIALIIKVAPAGA